LKGKTKLPLHLMGCFCWFSLVFTSWSSMDIF
jgi:hypothetical protein